MIRDIARERHTLDRLAGPLLAGGAVAGVAALGCAVLLALVSRAAGERFFYSYLVSWSYFASLSLGALFFVLLQHITRAGWSVVLRRLAEAAAANIALVGLLFIPLLFALHTLYPWADAAAAADDALIRLKQPYLNVPFFVARTVFYFAVWIWLSQTMLCRSLAQDRSGDPQLTLGLERLSAPGLLLFALTVTFAAFDWLMSLEPHWFSTIYGVYFFSGAVLGFLAALVLGVVLLQQTGRLARAVTVEHFHDLGKLLFGFVVFWAYIAFSQYMLQWYANLPEETHWYLKRQEDGWAAVSLFLLFGHFVVPFLALLSRYPKRHKGLLAVCAVWLLAMHWVDLYWLVMPEAAPAAGSPVAAAACDLLIFVGLAGLFVAGTVYWLRERSLVPEKDPRLGESLAFENA